MGQQDWGTGPGNRLMFITQEDSQHSVKEQVAAFYMGGGSIVQLRMKGKASSAVARKAQSLMGVLGEEGRLIVNDMWGTAAEVGAWGVHLGLSDGDPAAVRRQVGEDMVIGATAHSFEEVMRAAGLPVDYIGLGPLRFTSTKTNLTQILGLKGVGEILVKAREAGVDKPIFVIGGIENQDVKPLLEMGAYGIAVSGSIALASDPEFATRKFMESIIKSLR